MIRRILRRLKHVYENINFMIYQEKENATGASLRQKLYCYIRGFNSERYFLYEFEENDHRDYLPDFYKYRTTKINSPYEVVLNNKIIFEKIMKGKLPVPRNLGSIDGGDFKLEGKVVTYKAFLDFVRGNGPVMLKKVDGGGGKGIHKLESVDEELFFDYEPVTEEALLKNHLSKGKCLITEVFVQHNYASQIFPKSTNTIRIQTMIDPEDGRAFISAAVHKFGTDASAPVDNVSQGGITAGIDIETGIIGRPLIYSNENRLQRFDVHPETMEQITGVQVPEWQEVKAKMIELAESFPYLKYVGWDIAICDQGLCVIEGNNHTGIGLQMFSPFYQDPRAKRFFEHYCKTR